MDYSLVSRPGGVGDSHPLNKTETGAWATWLIKDLNLVQFKTKIMIAFVVQAFELATGDFLFEPHSGEDYSRDEGKPESFVLYFLLKPPFIIIIIIVIIIIIIIIIIICSKTICMHNVR